jgi:hypothetical protein
MTVVRSGRLRLECWLWSFSLDGALQISGVTESTSRKPSAQLPVYSAEGDVPGSHDGKPNLVSLCEFFRLLDEWDREKDCTKEIA